MMHIQSTEQALAYGFSVEGKRKKICNLKRRIKQWDRRFRDDMDKGDMQIASVSATMHQFYNEALEAATGKIPADSRWRQT